MEFFASNLSDKLKAVGARLFSKTGKPLDEPNGELSRYRANIETIRDMMLRYVIEPNPQNYSLVYRHLIAQEPRLDHAFGELIKSGYAPVNDRSDELVTAELQLNQIVECALDNLKAVEDLYNKSTSETSGYGAALEGRAKAIAKGAKSNAAIVDLVTITRAMIAKTRHAEEELRFRAHAMTDLQMSLSEARLRADTDALTGLANRRAFERELGAATTRATLLKSPMALAICDIDFFKSINDTHGHDTGDRVLQFVSDILRENCGDHAYISRHGGEEFVMIFDGISANAAYEIVDYARRDLSSRAIVNKETGQMIEKITFSAGISCFSKSKNISNMLRLADRALYRAKSDGRDCVVMSQD
jgi:diguanylate cyclase